MGSDVDWTWKFTPRAADQFDSLDTHIQDRICSKLDEIVEFRTDSVLYMCIERIELVGCSGG